MEAHLLSDLVSRHLDYQGCRITFIYRYSHEKKHGLLFRKSDFLFFKVSNTNMQISFFLGTKLLVRSLRYSSYFTNTSFVCQVAGISKRSNNKQKKNFLKKIGVLVFETVKNLIF